MSDRAAALRGAVIDLVAERGLHGSSVASIADRAGVAVGTVYVHFVDRDALIAATYREVKHELAVAALAGWDRAAPPEERFLRAWHQLFSDLAARPERARFLQQLDTSPYAVTAHGQHDATAAWALALDDLQHLLIPVDPELAYTLAFGPAVALAARHHHLAGMPPPGEDQRDVVARACWRAIRRPDSSAR